MSKFYTACPCTNIDHFIYWFWYYHTILIINVMIWKCRITIQKKSELSECVVLCWAYFTVACQTQSHLPFLLSWVAYHEEVCWGLRLGLVFGHNSATEKFRLKIMQQYTLHCDLWFYLKVLTVLIKAKISSSSSTTAWPNLAVSLANSRYDHYLNSILLTFQNQGSVVKSVFSTNSHIKVCVSYFWQGPGTGAVSVMVSLILWSS